MDKNSQEISHSIRAKELFHQGYNCSQAVFLAFQDEYGIGAEEALRLSSSFGGGMGRLREVCGAVTGMFMVAGLLYGYSDPKDQESKHQHYERIQGLARKFEDENHSIICRELLGLDKKWDSPIAEARTEEYYQKRPCAELVEIAAQIMEQYINDNKQE